MQSQRTNKEKIEELFIEALKDNEYGGLAFDSKHALEIDEEINTWKEITFENVNEDDFYEINLPFSINKFYWPKKSYELTYGSIQSFGTTIIANHLSLDLSLRPVIFFI